MNTTERLEYLRGELRAERISYGELAELQGLAEYIEPGDVELLEAAGVPEFDDVDPDTGRPIVYPAHCIIRGACYWLEPLNGGAPFLMSCPVSPGGAIDWGDVAEVGPDECAGYAEIMATLTPSR